MFSSECGEGGPVECFVDFYLLSLNVGSMKAWQKINL
jgi:hypothetical protein